MVARTARSPGGPATRAAAGRATRSWSRPSTSGVRPAFPARAPRHTWWNASRGLTQNRQVRVHRHGPDDVHAALDRGDAAAGDRRITLRVRVPRGELRA